MVDAVLELSLRRTVPIATVVLLPDREGVAELEFELRSKVNTKI